MNLAEFAATLAAVVIAGIAPVITMTVYLAGRIDRLGDRVNGVEVTLAHMDERLGHMEAALRDHAATHARLAHGRPQP